MKPPNLPWEPVASLERATERGLHCHGRTRGEPCERTDGIEPRYLLRSFDDGPFERYEWLRLNLCSEHRAELFDEGFDLYDRLHPLRLSLS